MAYELELAEGCKIHNFFHVLCPKKALGQHVVTFTELPLLDEEGELLLVLETREWKLQSRTMKEYLVKWKDLLVEDATWECE